ncbi:MAG: phosphatidate cytidylyltransferase [Candidatus Kapaibacterium sp.]
MSNLAKRVAVAAVGIPLAVLIVWYGGWLFFVFIAVLTALSVNEFYTIAENKTLALPRMAGIFLSLILIGSFWVTYSHGMPGEAFFLIFFEIILIVLISFMLQLRSGGEGALNGVGAMLTGFLYIPLLLSSLIGIREFGNFYFWHIHNYHFFHIRPLESAVLTQMQYADWGWLLLSVMAAIWICDSAAYFTGRAIGSHKLAPRVSPKKTWEGAVGGFIGGIAGMTAMAAFLIPQFPPVHAVIIGAIVGTIGQIGDLSESQLKRDAGVKDSSNLIPGHGGALDRFDSIIFVMPAVFIYLAVLTITNSL